MQEDLLVKHGYHIVGGHSAVKPCLWLGKSLRGEGGCYKSKFYGIKSHRCMQLTPVLDCTHRCLHCWRPFDVSLSCDKWDSPSNIVKGCLHEQGRLVSGYGGMDSVDNDLWREAREPAHAAISLAGEPTLYPHLRALVDEFMSRGITTFVVSNGTNPGAIRDIRPTQLYISINAPSREIYKKACAPVTDGWDNIMESLGYLARSASRTAVRITLVRGLNMSDPEGYAGLITMGEPDYVELKAYMHLGFSRKRLSRDAMPTHDEVRAFAGQVARASGYAIADESAQSRVVLLARDGADGVTKIG